MVSFEDKPMLGKFWEKAKKRPSYASAGIIDAIPLKMKMMMLPLMLFFKIKVRTTSVLEDDDDDDDDCC